MNKAMMDLIVENLVYAQVGLGGGGIGYLITGFLVITALAMLGFVLWLLSGRVGSEGKKKKLAGFGLILALPFIAFQILGIVLFGIEYWYLAIPAFVLFLLRWVTIRRRKNKIQQDGGINSESLRSSP